MSKKWYGSLSNRLEENKVYGNEIVVGMGVTEYGYSDRYAYEVVKVINQKHIAIRRMEVKRIDNKGMSDCQKYEYISNVDKPTFELVCRKNSWYEVLTYSKGIFEQNAKKIQSDFKTSYNIAYNYVKAMARLTSKQYNDIEKGKVVKKYSKWNISIGVMEEYYDFSF